MTRLEEIRADRDRWANLAHARLERAEKAEAEVKRLKESMPDIEISGNSEGAMCRITKGDRVVFLGGTNEGWASYAAEQDRHSETLERARAAEAKLSDPWSVEGNAAAASWKARVDAVEKWAADEFGDTTEFPTGLVFALFGSVAAELHEVGSTDANT